MLKLTLQYVKMIPVNFDEYYGFTLRNIKQLKKSQKQFY